MDKAIKVDANTKLYGILGHPVRHSLSPRLHNTEFQRLGMNAVYTAFEVEKGCLGLAFEGIRALGIQGANITIPFKEEAVEFIDEIPEDLDRAMGALNTIVNRDGKLYGYNTDAPGFLWALHKTISFVPGGKKVLVLGAGGAGRGAAFALARAGAEKIWIYNRTPDRAHGLIDYMADFFPETEIDFVPEFAAVKKEKIDLVVNATALGMQVKKRVS
jgi:shikimate dehydrogenase